MLKIKDLHKSFKKIKALQGINLSINKGEIFSLLGPNGAGKTTTIRIITGLTKKDKGKIFIKDFNIFEDEKEGKKLIGYVPQHINLDVELTVEENLIIHGLLYSMKKKEIKRKIDELLDYVGLIDRKKSKVKELSGGMRRRLVIARALMHEPELLLLDEPTVGLDPSIRRKIWWLIKKIQSDGATIFFTTHYIEEAEFLAERVAFIDNGKIIKIGEPQKLINSLGQWAVDIVENENLKTLFFNSKDEIKDFFKSDFTSLNIRRVNLEDVFISLTGKILNEKLYNEK